MSGRRAAITVWFPGLVCLLAAGPGVAGEPVAQVAPDIRVEYGGALTLPAAVSLTDGREVALTGLSGITWLGADWYVAVMDNSRHLLRLRLALAADGVPSEASGLEIVTLAAAHDYEDVTLRPGAGERVYVCEEDTPAIRSIRLADGTVGGEIPLPPVFRTRRPNRGLEALALDPDRTHLWTANEETLANDGPAVGAESGGVVRIARLSLAGDRSEFEVAYPVDPPHQFVPLLAGPRLSGVVALVAIGHGRLLVLERSAGPGVPPFENRIYLVDTSQARDVSGVQRDLVGRSDLFLAKTLVWSGQLGLNVEGLCLGPKLDENRRALVAIADNGGLDTPTQVATFTLSAAVTSP